MTSSRGNSVMLIGCLIVVTLMLLLTFVRPAHAQVFGYSPLTPAAPTSGAAPDFATVRPFGLGGYIVNHSNGDSPQVLMPLAPHHFAVTTPAEGDFEGHYIEIEPPADQGEDD